jgi:hypothetical protein
MAQTVAYLQDHELLDYAVLSEKAAAASAYFNELFARIKAAKLAEVFIYKFYSRRIDNVHCALYNFDYT